MARGRSPTSIEAEKLFRKGLKLAEIAEKLNVPAGTVRRWKSTQHWDEDKSERSEKKSERSDKKKANARKKGGQRGNKNAKGNPGGGAPLRNQNSVKHGAYRRVYWDTLDEEEMELIDDLPDEEEQLFLDNIRLFTVRERRILKAIKQYKDQKGKAYLYSTTVTQTKRKFKDGEEKELYEDMVAEKVHNGDRLPGQPYNEQISTMATAELISRLEKELSTVQRSKEQSINDLTKYRLEKMKMQGDTKGNEMVRKWATAVLRARGDSDGTESES